VSEAAKQMDQITVTFPDGSARSFDKGVSGLEIAESIAKSLAKASVAVQVGDELWDLSRKINSDNTVNLIKRDGDEGLELIRHDCAHVMAQAVQELFPGTQVTIGPNIENGFFYDFGRNEPFSTDDLEVIEKRMHDIIDRGEDFTREVWDRDKAIAYFKDKGESFKAELIEDLPGPVLFQCLQNRDPCKHYAAAHKTLRFHS